MIKANNIWHSPVNTYVHLDKLAKQIGYDALDQKPQYQPHREARVAAIMAFALFGRLKRPTFLQLFRPDPPDAILMQPSIDTYGDRDITQLEITRYIGSPRESLLQQLIRSGKTPKGWHKYNENYIMVVNVGIGLAVDYPEITDYLNKNNTPFPVWTVQEISSHPDTIAKVTIVNPEIYEMTINIGEAAYLFNKLKLPGVIVSKRAGSVEKVRLEYNKSKGPDLRAPWETIGLLE